MALNPEALKAAKKVVDATSILNLAAREVFNLIDPQQKNQFEILLLPEKQPTPIGETVLGEAKRLAKSALDLTVAQFYIQNMDIPHNAVDFTRFDYLQAITDMTYADEVTITFIENESSLVRHFLKNWMDLQFKRDEFHGGYLFADNQWLSRKKAIILPLARTGIPNTVWWEIRGLRFKSVENFAFSQQDPDPMMISCTFACDEVYLMSLLDLV